MDHCIAKFIFVLLAATGCLFIGSTFYYYAPWYQKVTKATAVIHPTKGHSAEGVVIFEHHSDGLHVTAHITGLAPGLHGFHIHEFGNCACDDGVCTGGHFNPTNQPHAGPNDTHRHVGDMGNVVANENGVVHYELVDTHMTLYGPNSIIGRGVIVHADPDDLVSQPTGDSGARIGCGTIGIAQPKP